MEVGTVGFEGHFFKCSIGSCFKPRDIAGGNPLLKRIFELQVTIPPVSPSLGEAFSESGEMPEAEGSGLGGHKGVCS